MTENKKKSNFFTTLLFAIVCAGIIRSFLFEPFHIPSSSMKPNLLIGDYVFVSKYSYGYSRYSFPFGLDLFKGRFLKRSPKRGDIVVFRLPSDPKINYIKRVIGLPGDKIQVLKGVVYLNGKKIEKTYFKDFIDNDAGSEIILREFKETLPEGKEINTLDQVDDAVQDNTGLYEVPQNHYFMMGDNRDNSQDSRFLSQVGFVPEENLIGRAEIIFFSNSAPSWQLWRWPTSVRFNRIFKRL